MKDNTYFLYMCTLKQRPKYLWNIIDTVKHVYLHMHCAHNCTQKSWLTGGQFLLSSPHSSDTFTNENIKWETNENINTSQANEQRNLEINCSLNNDNQSWVMKSQLNLINKKKWIALSHWAGKQGFKLEITGLDLSECTMGWWCNLCFNTFSLTALGAAVAQGKEVVPLPWGWWFHSHSSSYVELSKHKAGKYKQPFGAMFFQSHLNYVSNNRKKKEKHAKVNSLQK